MESAGLTPPRPKVRLYLPKVSDARQHEMETGAAVGIVFGPKSAAVSVNDGAAYGQAKAHTFGTSGVERIKDARQTLRGDSAATIGDGDANPFRRGAGAHEEFAAFWLGIGHGMAGICNQVEEHLLELDSVAVDRGQFGGKFGAQVHVPVHYIVPQQFQQITHDGVEIEGLHVDVAPAVQQAQPPDDFGCPAVSGHYIREDFPHLPQVRRVTRKMVLRDLDVAHDGAEGLVEFVGEQSGELTEHGQAGKAGQFIALLLDLEFGLLEGNKSL